MSRAQERAVERLFEEFDDNGDGFFEMSKFVAAFQDEEFAASMMHRMDTNEDDRVSLAEFKADFNHVHRGEMSEGDFREYICAFSPDAAALLDAPSTPRE
jgi:Ca2+-binding EF-hand superfamily protein